ncbi:hypothetical protein [Actinosynnema sp. NPDC020468]|uniref:hypothetical protein n=1 Tax=Actinosynnema sp. NPDC020468 TaxID=3154488 RepID=UPI0033EAABF7
MIRSLVAALALVAATATPVQALPLTRQITATPAVAAVDPQQSTTISGEVTEETSPGVWTGVGGAGVHGDLCLNPACTDIWGGGANTSADAGGHYTLTVTPYRTGYWRISGGGAQVVTTRLGVRQDLSLSLSAPSRDAAGVVRSTGTLFIGSKILPPEPLTVRIEFSPDGVTWQHRSSPTVYPLLSGLFHYFVTVTEPASGYWRAVHDGTADSTTPRTTGGYYLT